MCFCASVLCVCVCVCVFACVCDGIVRCLQLDMDKGMHCAPSTFHYPDSTLTDVTQAAKNPVNINMRLLCVF